MFEILANTLKPSLEHLTKQRLLTTNSKIKAQKFTSFIDP